MTHLRRDQHPRQEQQREDDQQAPPRGTPRLPQQGRSSRRVVHGHGAGAHNELTNMDESKNHYCLRTLLAYSHDLISKPIAELRQKLLAENLDYEITDASSWAIFRKIPPACLFEFSTWDDPAFGLPAGTVCHLTSTCGPNSAANPVRNG
jgi:hypothetical protein